MSLIHLLIPTLLIPLLHASATPYLPALEATVRITGGSASGTAFIVATGSTPPHLLVTAAHVFHDIKSESATTVLRSTSPDGHSTRNEISLPIRSDGQPLWQKHPELDIATIPITLPETTAIKPFPLDQIATTQHTTQNKIHVGQGICIPGYPAQLESTPAGWAVLRRGSIASHPLTPLEKHQTFLVDSPSFGGESGAPVVAWVDGSPLVIGIITSMQRQTDKSKTPFEEKTTHTPLTLGIAVQAPYIRQTITSYLEK
ncbi:MAG: serine protease [Verrucomicrobiales bacterium]|nr:serine protease [Verrucomicrobiales bacterium]